MELLERRPDLKERGARASLNLAVAVALLSLALVCAVAAKEITNPGFLGARDGLKYVIINAVLIAGTVGICAHSGEALRRTVLSVVAIAGLVVTLLVIGISGNFGSLIVAGAILFNSRLIGNLIWRVGWRGTCPWPAAITIGCGVIALAEFLLGITGWLSPWIAAWPLLGIAAIVLIHRIRSPSVRGLSRARINDLLEFLSASPLSSAVFCTLVINTIWEATWAAAPEIQYDALYAKAWLPSLWASTGRIQVATYTTHPVMGVTGTAELLAIPGHLLAQPATGRFLQFLVVVLLSAAVWWWGNSVGSKLAPIWALVVGLTPQLAFQASTAYDDALLTFWCVGLAIVVASDHLPTPRSRLTSSACVGVLGGACLAAKLDLVAFVVVALFGWAVKQGRPVTPKIIGLAAGGMVTFGPQRLWLWVTTDNPVFPLYNNVFRSPYFAAINENYNFPYFMPHGLTALVSLPWTTFRYPSDFVEAVPPAGYLALPALLFLVLLFGWTRGRAALPLWGALWAAFGLWWWEVRYLRYLLPYTVVAVIVLCMPNRIFGNIRLFSQWHARRLTPSVQALLVGVLGIAAFVPTVASFWDVPSAVPIDVDLGRQSVNAYLRQAVTGYPALQVFDRLATSGSVAIGDAYARTLLRSGLDLTPTWEAEGQVTLHEPFPKTAEASYDLLTRHDIRWALVTGPQRASGGSNSFLAPIIQHWGELVYAASGWNLYRLVRDQTPAHYRCATGSSAPSCVLKGPPTSAWSESLPSCPGNLYRLTLHSIGPGSIRAFLIFPAAAWDANNVDVPAGQDGILYATVPKGASKVEVVIDPLDSVSRVEKISLMMSGKSCP